MSHHHHYCCCCCYYSDPPWAHHLYHLSEVRTQFLGPLINLFSNPNPFTTIKYKNKKELQNLSLARFPKLFPIRLYQVTNPSFLNQKNKKKKLPTLQTTHIAHSFTIKIPFLDKQTPKAHIATTSCPFSNVQALDPRLKSCKTNKSQEPVFLP